METKIKNFYTKLLWAGEKDPKTKLVGYGNLDLSGG